jgi:hypothetical protein
VERLRPAWLLSLPLLAVAWLSAHALAYELVPVEQHGHGYLAQAPLFLTLCAATASLALAARMAGRRGRALPSWPAGLLPLLGFALQEHLERLFHDGSFPLSAALEPTFAVGLALQLPFAFAALVFARALARLACSLGRSLRRQAPPRRRSAPSVSLPVPRTLVPRIAVLAFGQPERGPPLVLSG